MAQRENYQNRGYRNRGRGRPRDRGSQGFTTSRGRFNTGSQATSVDNERNYNKPFVKSLRGVNDNQMRVTKPTDMGYLLPKSNLTFSEVKNLLNKMLEEDFQENIPLKLLDSQVRILNFLNNEQIQDSQLVKTILKVIIKANNNKMMEKNFRELLTMVLGTKFAKKRLDNVISIELNTDFDIDMLQLLITFLKLNFEIIPGIAYDVFYNRIYNLKYVIDNLQMKTNFITSEIISEFEELKEMVESSKVPEPVKTATRRTNVFNDIEPPDDYKNISIFPTSQDLINVNTSGIFLRENKSRGAYKSVDHYLDVQFRLMREDFIQPLREGLTAYKNHDKKKYPNIRIYKKVVIMNSLPAERLGIIHNIHFDKSNLKKIKWVQSKRFLYGSLLCLSSDNFKTLLFATVANRDIRDLEHGVLSVKFLDCIPSKDEEYTMLETVNMFESYRHVLLKLQSTNEENLCMKKYLVYAEDKICLPGYLARNQGLEYKFKNKRLWPGDETREWPRGIDLDMDESQFQAFKSALTKEITIIQGPPGTGKTYLGLNICECLIKNVQAKLLGFGPILIVCYTNHALDQFLEGISNFTDKIIRIGSRCKSEKLQQFSLPNWKKKCPSKEFSRQKWNIFSQLKDLQNQLIYKQAALKSSQEKLISLDTLEIFIGEEQFHYLKRVGLKKWLYGESLSDQTFMSECSVDTIIEWLMYEEIICNVHQIVIDAQAELLKEFDNFNEHDMDNEVNYINNQRRLDIDDEDIENLNFEFNRVLNQFGEPDEFISESSDGFTQVKNKTTERLFKNRLRKKENMSQERAAEIQDLDFLSIEDRWSLYRHWRSKYTDFLHQTSKQLENDYDNLSNQINEIHFEEDRLVMKDQDIVAMTTTGAARYNKVLSLIRCKIIIVEEAAEVLESHIIGSLNPGCEHLILIGDHKQLKPNPAVFELAKKYELDVSLFERLINNNLHYNTLNLQHRMRPEIAEIMQFIYTNLQNHESVLNYPNIPSVDKNLFFLDHSEPEECAEEIMSYSNLFEAEFIVKFCRHLMKNGVERTQMTILTLYSGQMFLFKRLMDKQIFEGVRVCVVDNYQGEENDIILLSLVRSNEHQKIGFLSVENRICVCLSRAKHGLYVFGNFNVLANQNDKWREICQYLKRRNHLGFKLNLLCQNHPQKSLLISKPSDFDKYPEGGCEELCNQRLSCGHACRKACHFLDKNHENNKCMERCTRLCENGHRCILKCWQTCQKCNIKIEKVIPGCNHIQLMACSKLPEEKDCLNKCQRMLLCGHECVRLCKDKCSECIEKIDKISPECGHLGRYDCSDMDIICTKPCESILGCDHKCEGTCGSCYMGRLHVTCQSNCKTQLVCGHACNAKCSYNCPPCPRRCEEGCSHNACPNNCGESCVSCFEKCMWKCKHEICNKLCYELCDRKVCNFSCDKLPDCRICKKRFQCYGICGEPCRKTCLNCDPTIKDIFFGTEDEINAKFITLWTCGHTFEVNSMDNYMSLVSNNGEILTKKCPVCNTIINKRSCFRYLNIVKKISFDIKIIQQKVIDSLNIVKYSNYSRKLDICGTKIANLFKIYNIKNYFNVNDTLSQFKLQSFNISLELVYEIYQQLPYNDKSVNNDYIRKCIHHLIIWLNPNNRKFNEFEIAQFYVEFDRINMLVKVISKQQQNNMKEILDFITELKNITFSGEIAKDFKRRWSNFEKEKLYLPNMEITEHERRNIVNAIGLDKGRWFKCPQGHFYVIGECGGATQISKCPECNCNIGGTNHRLLEDNHFAPEMDNANQPAWPGMAAI